MRRFLINIFVICLGMQLLCIGVSIERGLDVVGTGWFVFYIFMALFDFVFINIAINE